MDDDGRMFFGIVLIAVGVIWAWIGDLNIPTKGGKILKNFSASAGKMHRLKWLMGGALIFTGFATIFHW